MAICHRYPADHPGPLFPPPAFVRALQELDGDALVHALDQAVLATLEQQRDDRISLATDGELRRSFPLHGTDLVEEVRFARALTDMPVKVRVPRPVSASSYSPNAIADVRTLQALIDAGANYIQLDGMAYAPLIHRRSREALAVRGTDPDRRIGALLAQDVEALLSLERDIGVKMTVCFHDVADDSVAPFGEDLDPDAARRVLYGLPVDRFMFDCGPADESDVSFLRLVPDDMEVVLGLIDVRSRDLPDVDTLMRRIERAAKYVDRRRLALSTRHAISAAGSADPDECWAHQARLLALLHLASRQAWGCGAHRTSAVKSSGDSTP